MRGQALIVFLPFLHDRNGVEKASDHFLVFLNTQLVFQTNSTTADKQWYYCIAVANQHYKHIAKPKGVSPGAVFRHGPN